jgi:hypothetical protein
VTAITPKEIRRGARKYIFGHEEKVYLNAVLGKLADLNTEMLLLDFLKSLNFRFNML